MMTDPIADMLTRIRNASEVYKPEVGVPHSIMKENIVKVLKQEGYVKDYRIHKDSAKITMFVSLKYGSDGEKVIRTIKRESRPGCKVYSNVKNMKKVLGGLGIAIVSTSKGILTDKECREKKIGGEILCTVC